MQIKVPSGSKASVYAGIANRGLGNEGLYFQKGLPYEGYFFAFSDKPVEFEVRIMGGDDMQDILAMQRIAHTPPARDVAAPDSKVNPGWVQHKFSLTPAEGTECVGIPPGSDLTVHCTSNPGTAHICVKCGGQFAVGVVSDTGASASAHVAYVVLQPASWGRFKGLNARKDVADTLTAMGIKAIRLGGSFCSVTKHNGAYYQWQRWTGPVWDRPSIGAHWDSYRGDAYNLIGGWGPFEMIDYATALGAEPIITTTMTSSPDEFADLVEYCWGNATTPMGAQRIRDQHPEPYRLRFVELGNEQYNGNYIAQVKAMEERANQVGVAGQLHYIFPSNNGVAGKDIAAAASLDLGDRLVTDIHVGAGGALSVAQKLFDAHAKGGLGDDAAVNFETNAGTHHHGRALDEAADLNAFFNAGEQRMLARTASFCHGRSGHYDMFDQQISFFLPNMTWLQPPGHVHAMITKSWQPHVVNASVGPSQGPPPSWTAYNGSGYTCTSSEYRGTTRMDNNSVAGCLAAVEKMATQGVNYGIYPGNNNCYVCSIAGDIASKLGPKPGAVSFVGKNIRVPTSVSAQLSADGKTLVARIVNHGAPAQATLALAGFRASAVSASTLASDDLTAENTPSEVDHVAPEPVQACSAHGDTVVVSVPGMSYTVVTMTSE